MDAFTTPDGWRKTSFSGAVGNCVELNSALGAVRDSKNPNGPALPLTMAAFVTTAKSGKLDRPAC